jgi:beta-lactamase superfamily II metal-dependent hydrolase
MSKTSKLSFVLILGLSLVLFLPPLWSAKPVLAAGTCGTGTWTSGNLEIHHINIGQGDSALIVGPTGKSLLFDAGESSWNSSAKAQIIGPYIEAVLGCKSLDYVVISHFHLDHIGYVGYGGLWHLVETQGFTVGTTLIRNYNTHLGDISGTFTNWKAYLEGTGQAKLHPTWAFEGAGQVDLGTGVTFDIVVVNGNGALIAGDFHNDSNPPSENDYSIGAILSYGNFDEWLGGDLDGQYEVAGFGYTYHDIELSVAPEVGDVDVYKANHHGSSHSSSATFVNQLDPEVSIVTTGNGNTYGHPTQQTIDRLLATSTVYLTERGDTNTNIGSAIVAGNIVIKTSNGSTYTVNGTSFTATEPTRTDTDGDGYFAEADPDDSSFGTAPAPNGGCGPNYQTCSVSCQVSPGQVVINEVFPAPSNNGVEWVELYNPTGNTINIGYCYIDDIVGGSAAYQIPASTLIPAHGFWTLDRTSYFNNGGDEVRFLKENGTTILDSFTYGSTSSDLAWYRSPDGSVWGSSPRALTTKGQSNGGAIFADVQPTYWAWNFVERLYKAGITGGCTINPLNYCPESSVTRAQMAVFLLRGIYSSSYAPPDVAGNTGFGDVPAGYWAAAWIKQLGTEGITGGCGSGNYCPEAPVTRAQMAVFLLRSKYGASYSPPALGNTTGFADVEPTYWAGAWIKQLVTEGITTGCGNGIYCPESPVTRAQMAVFLVRTFSLP